MSGAVEGVQASGEHLDLASSYLAAAGASILALPGLASDRCNWVDFVRNLKRSHARALFDALEFYYKFEKR